MVSSEKWQKRITLSLVSLLVVALIIMMSGGLSAKGAWGVAMIALLAAIGTFYLGSTLFLADLKQHILDVSAHPGGLEAINQDLEKMGNIVAEQREALRQIPDLRSRIDRAESWESDLAKGAQALAQSQEFSRIVSDLNISATSRFEGLAASLRELRTKIGDLESLRQRPAEAQQLASGVADLKKSVEHLAGLPAQLAAMAERVAALAPLGQEVAALKEQLDSVGSVPDDLGKLAEHHKTHTETISSEMASLSEDIESLKDAMGKLTPLSNEIEKLHDEVAALRALAGQPAKTVEPEGLKKQVAELAKTVAALQARPAAAPAAGGAAAPPAGLEALTAELAEIKTVMVQLQAEQPNLDINVKEAKLVSQQDRTVIVCSLTVRNLSNKPNEITAVRAELDSGRERLAPTSIRHWLPDGKQTNEERLILLPQKVLENSTTAPITLTAIGWPLEKTLESYAFRITVRDKNGNEYVKNHRLAPEPAGK